MLAWRPLLNNEIECFNEKMAGADNSSRAITA
jgi:hypothetical protein